MSESTGGAAATPEPLFDRAAAGWKRWAALFSQRTDTALYVELAAVRPGQRVLDLGAGTGDQTLALAEAVAPGGRVVATDVSAAMLDVARERVADAGLDNVEFMVADAGQAELGEGGFDAAVSGFTLMFMPAPEAAAANVYRGLAPGGRFVASVWSVPPAVPMLSLPMMTALGEVGGPPPDPGGPGLFALADPARLQAVFVNAGFEDVAVAPRRFPFTFPSAAEYARFIRDVAPPITDLINQRAPEKAEAVWEKIAAVAAARAAADGTVLFDNEALFVTGRR